MDSPPLPYHLVSPITRMSMLASNLSSQLDGASVTATQHNRNHHHKG
ncbi:MAG: hypothetical protein K6347_06135 [Campylobacterales bacterium]